MPGGRREGGNLSTGARLGYADSAAPPAVDLLQGTCDHAFDHAVYGPNHRLDEAQFAALAEALTAAAEAILAAKGDKIQILPNELAHQPFGRPVGIEIKARAEAGRPDAVVEAFLTCIDDISFAAFGDRCRIRYLCFPSAFLAARN